jgi:hypothetical protein
LLTWIVFGERYDLHGLGGITGADSSCNSIEDTFLLIARMSLHSGTEPTFVWLHRTDSNQSVLCTYLKNC